VHAGVVQFQLRRSLGRIFDLPPEVELRGDHLGGDDIGPLGRAVGHEPESILQSLADDDARKGA
jgi:hypothetical protein